MKYSEKQIQEAYEKIEKLRKEAYEKINEAEKLADEFRLEFSFRVAYGMGGWYNPKGSERSKYDYNYDEENKIREEGEWRASSHSC